MREQICLRSLTWPCAQLRMDKKVVRKIDELIRGPAYLSDDSRKHANGTHSFSWAFPQTDSTSHVRVRGHFAKRWSMWRNERPCDRSIFAAWASYSTRASFLPFSIVLFHHCTFDKPFGHRRLIDIPFIVRWMSESDNANIREFYSRVDVLLLFSLSLSFSFSFLSSVIFWIIFFFFFFFFFLVSWEYCCFI